MTDNLVFHGVVFPIYKRLPPALEEDLLQIILQSYPTAEHFERELVSTHVMMYGGSRTRPGAVSIDGDVSARALQFLDGP